MYNLLNFLYLFTFILLLIGCQAVHQYTDIANPCDIYARRESLQSEISLFVPDKGTLTLKEAVDCVGEPELYRADISFGPHGSVKRVDLWYPNQGMVIIGTEWTDTPIQAKENDILSLPIERIFYTPVDTEPINIADKIYREFNREAQENRINELQLWEGWDEVEIILSSLQG